jgi:5-methylcytosine-specific restriction endonuclease McrA
MVKNCNKCGCEFNARKERKYCSKNCYIQSIPEILGNKEKRNCLHCLTEFITVPSSIKKFCKNSCSQKHRWSDPEYRKQMSEAHKGQPNKWKGKKRPEITGENHPNWKGGYVEKQKRFRAKPETKEKRKFYELQRYYRSKGAAGEFSEQEWLDVKKKYNYTCLMCNEKEPTIRLTVDHVIPLSKGGSNFISNIQPLCFCCNSKKRTDDTDYRKLHYKKLSMV